MDKFREPEQFDAEVEIHGGEPFAVWAPAVNGSHVKAEQYFALLAELEAKDQAHRVHAARLISERGVLRERVTELESKLATPVRLPQLCGDGDNDSEYTEGLNDGITRSAIYLRRQGFTVEGDE